MELGNGTDKRGSSQSSRKKKMRPLREQKHEKEEPREGTRTSAKRVIRVNTRETWHKTGSSQHKNRWETQGKESLRNVKKVEGKV